MPALSVPQPSYRGLWSSVVLQAIEDIENQPMQSIAFDEAVAFFTRSGRWAESRTMIGDFLELHRDDLETIGKHCINARVTREELPPEPQQQSPDAVCVTPLKLARLVAGREAGRSRALDGSGPRTQTQHHSQTGHRQPDPKHLSAQRGRSESLVDGWN
jgi:hypothetical protein